MIWYDPFEEFKRMQQEMDMLFKRIYGSRSTLPSPGSEKGKRGEIEPFAYAGFRTPVSNVYETDNKLIASFELPGIEKEDINLNVTDNNIEIKVEKKAETKEKKKGFYLYEARSQSFYRQIPLPAKVEADKATAKFRNGVLTVEIPKSQRALKEKKRIPIE